MIRSARSGNYLMDFLWSQHWFFSSFDAIRSIFFDALSHLSIIDLKSQEEKSRKELGKTRKGWKGQRGKLDQKMKTAKQKQEDHEYEKRKEKMMKEKNIGDDDDV